MKSTLKISSAAAIVAVAAAAALPVASAGADGDVYCHGKIATYVGTAGDDVVTDEDVDLGRNPVIALGDGNDTLEVGTGWHDSLDSLTACGGSGDDAIHVTERIGGHAIVTLDGGLDDDDVGNESGLNRSDLARMRVIGGNGNDILRGGNGNDDIDAGRGDDSAYGVGGRDHMTGGSGDDDLYGQRGSDHLLGGAGRDDLDGDMPGYPDGRDVADGGGNQDRCEAEIEKRCEIR